MRWQLAIFLSIATIAAPCRALAMEPLLTRFGLGTIVHPLQAPSGTPVPKSCPDHVYVFAVNGVDPLCLANFNGLCQLVKDQGFANTRFGQLYTCNLFAREIRAIRANDPQARIVLMGYSLGCNYVRCLTHALGRDGIQVDLLVYVAGDFTWDMPRCQPDNASRVLNITAHGFIVTGGDLLFRGAELGRARNCRLNTRHFLAPSRQETVAALLEELAALSSNAPAAPDAAAASPSVAGGDD